MQPGQFNPGGFDFVRELQNLQADFNRLAAANPFAAMGIAPKEGGVDVQGFINSLRADSTVSLSMDDDGAFTVFGPDGVTAVARLGPLDNSAPGEYGVEVLVGATWVQLGNQTTTWDGVSGRPGTVGGATIDGSFITGTVPNATEATHAAQADGSQYGWTNNVAGTEFYALWVGNDGGFHLGRNVSSIKYKENVTDAAIAPAAVLNLRPVRYDRKPSGATGEFPGAKNEFGLIAEEVAQHVPELVTYFGGAIDGVRYDLLGVALLPVVKQQAADIAALQQAVRDMGGTV